MLDVGADGAVGTDGCGGAVGADEVGTDDDVGAVRSADPPPGLTAPGADGLAAGAATDGLEGLPPAPGDCGAQAVDASATEATIAPTITAPRRVREVVVEAGPLVI